MKTPDELYLVHQNFPTLKWQVVPLGREQGEAMRRRGESRVFDTREQAYAVVRRLNVELEVKQQ